MDNAFRDGKKDTRLTIDNFRHVFDASRQLLDEEGKPMSFSDIAEYAEWAMDNDKDLVRLQRIIDNG